MPATNRLRHVAQWQNCPVKPPDIVAARESAFDVVDGARSRHRGAIGWFVGDESHQRSCPHADYHDRFGYRQERVPGSRYRRGREGRREKATSPRPGDGVLRSDAADAEAICEAVRRPTMRFVAVKSAEQQGRLMQHRVRDLLMRQRTQLINALRAHLAELGIAAAQGREGIKELLAIVAQNGDSRLPVDAHASLIVLSAQLQAVQTMIGSIEKRIVSQHRSNADSKRLETIPGIGVIGATTIAAVVPDPKVFRSGRDFAAWIGLGPRQDSTGGKQKLGPISKQG